MHHSRIVEDDASAAVHLLLHDHFRPFEDVSKRFARGNQLDELVMPSGGKFAHKGRGPMYPFDVGHDKREHGVVCRSFGDVDWTFQDSGFGIRVEVAVVVILVADIVGHQMDEHGRILRIKTVDGLECVGESRLPTHTFIVYAVEELEGWGLPHVE